MTEKQTNLQKLDEILKKNQLANDLFDIITRSNDPDETRAFLREFSVCIMNDLETFN